ncbi:hypothetical protein Q7P35_003007 [Cladosporium inversicolor]
MEAHSGQYEIRKAAQPAERNASPPYDSQSSKKDDDAHSEEFQDVVQRVRAITEIWSRKTLGNDVCTFVDALLLSVQVALNPYITSSFHRHGLLTTVGVVANLMSGCSKLTLAEFVDIFGRIEGFLLMMFVSVLSLILKAVCTGIEMYFAAHTLYWIGHIGLKTRARLILIAGVAIMPLTVLSIFMWKNINVKKLEQERETQTKGTVL